MMMNTKTLLTASLLASIGVGIAAFPAAARGPGGGPCADMGPGTMMLDTFDENDDSKITLEEFQTGHDEMFASMDANKDGKVTLEEFETAPKPGKELRIQRMFRRIDVDGDGVVTREEFETGSATRFAQMDLNGDHVITIEELRQAKPLGKWGGKGPGGGPGAGPNGPQQ
jgi:EF-hand domain pair